MTGEALGKEVFSDCYKITTLETLTRATDHHSFLLYKLIPVVGTNRVEERFVALFAREEDAYDYVAIRTAIDAGLDKQRTIDELAGIIKAKRVEIQLQMEEEDGPDNEVLP